MVYIKSPMLASPYDPKILKFPVMASPKIDGLRATIVDGVVLSRSGKPIKNKMVQEILGHACYNGLDGELTSGSITDKNVFSSSTKNLTRGYGTSNFDFNVFDDCSNPELPFLTRLNIASNKAGICMDGKSYSLPNIKILPHRMIHSAAELDAYEADCLAQGFEGVMIRDPHGAYKFGRSTPKEGGLLKVKRFEHDEAVIVGYEVLMHNDNAAEKNELGRTKRSDKKEGLRESDMIGALVVKSEKYEKTFNVSCGSMTHDERREALARIDLMIGKIVRFKYFAHGMVDVPRHPLFAGFRSPDDMS